VAQRVGRGIALLFHDRGTRRGWVISSTPRPHFNSGKDPVPISQEVGWAPGPVWTGGKSRPHRDSIPDLPARSSVAIPTELPSPHGKLTLVEVKKVKCTLVQALRVCRVRTTPRGSRGIALLFLYRDSRRGWGVSITPRPLFTPGKDTIPILQEAGWFPGPVWMGGISRPHRDSIPDRPASSQSLYRLSYRPTRWVNISGSKKVKCTLIQALRLCRGLRPIGGSRGIALLFLDRDTRRGWGVNITPRPLFTPGKDPIPILQEAGWVPGPVWMGGIFRPHRDSIPDRPARNQSLYRLSYRPTTISGASQEILCRMWSPELR